MTPDRERTAVALVPSLTAPPAEMVALLTLISGIAQGGLMPTLNALFVLALPDGYRARAFGVIQGGMQICQCGAVLATGILAERAAVPTVVGLWSVGGTLLMALLAARWPGATAVDRAVASAAEADAPRPSNAPSQADSHDRAVLPWRTRAGATRVTPDNG